MCDQYWWPNLLFIQNLYPWGNVECVGWVWYLAIDMQLFLITIPILWVYHKWRTTAHFIILGLQIVCAVYTLVLSYSYDMPASTIAILLDQKRFEESQGKYQTLIYLKPWGRMGAYFIGVTFAIFFFEYLKQDDYYANLTRTFGAWFFTKVRKSRCTRYLCYILGVSLTSFCVFI